MDRKDDILILALETSCDETAAAVVKNGLEIESNIVASQIDWHRKYGGVVPEIASRKHLEFINPVIAEAITEADIKFADLSAVAATYGPGLVGGLLVGLSTAKALAYAMDKPFIGVNHIAGHIYANFISHNNIKTPVVCLTVSGGHTDLLYFTDPGSYNILGRTRDDAAGEAFDKVARFLKLGYPGGPVIEDRARQGNPAAVNFTRALINEDTYDFSFSGLKTAVINYVHNKKQKNEELNIADIAASFQETVIDMLVSKVLKALDEYETRSVILSGGVAANGTLRNRLREELKPTGLPLYYPDNELCTDNAAMIGSVAYYKYINNDFSPLSLNANPNLKL